MPCNDDDKLLVEQIFKYQKSLKKRGRISNPTRMRE